MTKIENVKSEQTAKIQGNKGIKGQRASLKQNADTVEVPKSNRRKKIGITLAAVSLAATIAAFVVMVGRNPAKAAKVLKGHNKITSEAYKKGIETTEKIFNSEGTYKFTQKDLFEIFEKPKYRTRMESKIETLEEYIRKKNIPEDSELVQAVKKIKNNLNAHIKNSEQNLAQGITIDSKFNQRFLTENEKEFETIRKCLEPDKYKSDCFSVYTTFETGSIHEWDVAVGDYIKECPEELLPKDGILFHGTRHGKAVFKSGMSPYVSNQLNNSPRELGAAIYATPDARVAASFSGLSGNIIPLKIENGTRIAFVSETAYRDLNKRIGKFVTERIPKAEFEKLSIEEQNAIKECIVSRVFKEAGYDAAYIPKGVKGGGIFANILNPNINEVIGVNQSQVVVFSPEKLSISSRSLKERICDLKLKFESLSAQIKWAHEHPFGL